MVPLLVFSIYFSYLKIESYTKSRNELAISTLNGLSAVFEGFNDSVSEVLRTYSQVDVFQKSELSDEDRHLIFDLVSGYSKNSDLQEIAFGTISGEMFTPNFAELPEDYDPRYRPWYMEASRLSGDVVISPPYRDARDPGKWTLSYALQVLDDEGNPTGVLGTDLELKGLENYFNQYFSSFSGRIIILDANSNIVIEKEKGIFKLSSKKGIAFELIHSDGINIDLTYDGVEYKMDKGTVPNMSWSIVLLTPKNEIFNDIMSLLIPLVAMFALAMFIMHMLFVAARKSLIQPLETFSHQIDEIGVGDYPEKIYIKTAIPRELHIIETAVNRMLDRIRKQTTKLQHQKEEINGQYEEINALYEETTAMNDSLNDLVDELQESYRTTIYSLTSAIEANDAYTKGHCDRVKEYSVMLGKELGLSESELQTLEYAAILHDIGKVGIPTDILNKPTKLTEDEYKIVQGHPAIGAQILKDIPYLQTVCKVIEQHHERVDGKGYPYGLVEKEIHPYAKILCIADAFDAMTSSRPYRNKAMTTDEALKELVENSETQFSKRMVDQFLIIHEKNN